MKNKKITAKIIFGAVALVMLSVICGSASEASAAKRAVFPDAKKLQPMPTNAQPNVSGNINSQLIPAPISTIPNATKASGSNAMSDQDTQNSQAGLLWPVIVFSAITIAGIWLLWFFKKPNENDQI